jgi:hypothetical protein
MHLHCLRMLGGSGDQLWWKRAWEQVDNLAQLLYTVAMSGYMMRNAQYRLELSDSLDRRWQDGE